MDNTKQKQKITKDLLFAMLEKFSITCTVEQGLSKNTLSSYRSDLEDFICFNSLPEINKAVIRKYLESLYLKKLKRSSYLRKISALNRFMQFLLEEKVLDENPMVEIKRPKKEKRIPKFLTPAEIELLIETAAKTNNKFSIRASLIIEFLYASGMRISELLGLKLSDVNTSDSLIMIKGKGNKERLVPLRKQTFALIEKYLPIRKEFVHKDGNKYLFCSRSKAGHLTREQVGMELKKIATLANIDHTRVSPHVLRHSFATNLCNNKVNLRVVQELLGHSDIATTEIYIDTMDREIVDFVKEYHPMGKK